MARIESIRAKGLEKHINEWFKLKDLDYTFADFEKWVSQIDTGDEYGEKMTVSRIQRLLRLRQWKTADYWIKLYKGKQA